MGGFVSGFIQEVSDAVTRFFDAFQDEAKKKMEQLAKQMEEEGEDINEDELPNDCVTFLDPDPLKQSLDQSKEAIDGKVGAIETEITVALNKDKDDVAKQVEED